MVLVQLGLNKPIPALPKTIKVPVRIMDETGLPRRYAIKDRDQEVPSQLREWMLTQPQYRGWFKEGEPIVVVAQDVVPVEPDDAPTTDERKDETPPPPKEADASETDETPPEDDPAGDETPPEDDPEADEKPIDAMNVEELREFARNNDINLKGASRKDDILEEIRRAVDTDTD